MRQVLMKDNVLILYKGSLQLVCPFTYKWGVGIIAGLVTLLLQRWSFKWPLEKQPSQQ